MPNSHSFRIRLVLILGLLLSGNLPASLASERLSPSGLAGAVLLVPGNEPDEKALATFARLAGGAEAKTVILSCGEAGASKFPPAIAALFTAPCTTITVPQRDQADQAETLQAIEEATAIWIDASLPPSELSQLLAETKLAAELAKARQRGKTLGMSGTSVPLAAAQYVVTKPEPGLNLLPGMLYDGTLPGDAAEVSFAAIHDQSPGLLGVRVASGASLLLRGRDIRQLSQGEVSLRLAKGGGRDAKPIAIDPGQSADYNEVLRAASGRDQPAFPPREVGVPEVASGALVIVGGGGMPVSIGEKFVALGGGEEGRFVIFPTSMPDPLPADTGAAMLKRFGAKHVTVMSVREQAELETPENLAILQEATGIWFGGGRQWRFVDAYAGTKVEPLLHDVLKRGGVIGGSSAGATIQGEYLVRGAPAGPHIMMCEGYERGLNFLPGTAIDQHFTQRKRFFDMSSFMKTYPQYLGIGIDESTAIIVRGHEAEVLGRGAVHFYDWRTLPAPGEQEYTQLRAGARYDLKGRAEIKSSPEPEQPDSAPPATP